MSVRTPLLAAALTTATVVLVSAALPPVIDGSLGGRQVFPRTNWWNADITRAPLASDSAAYINFISGRTAANPTASKIATPTPTTDSFQYRKGNSFVGSRLQLVLRMRP